MSCYEWEEGSVKLSVAEYSKFKKAFMSGMKDVYNKAYDNSVSIYESILSKAKGKRNIDWHDLFNSCRYRNYEVGSYFRRTETKDLDPLELAFNSMFRKKSEGGYTENVRPMKPRKGDFKSAVKGKNPRFGFDEFDISFDDKNRLASWSVEENNHACEHARDHIVGDLFFNVLGKVNWTRGTGGVIVGNNEYNQDDRSAFGGSNTINNSYGPIGKEERKRALNYC
jgi:hypothetical protein